MTTYKKNCEPGDVRIRHFVFRALNVSLIALKRGRELVVGNANGFPIGIVRKGNVLPERMFDAILKKYDDDINLHKIFMALGWIVGLIIVIRDGKQRCMAFVVLCWAIGMVRSLVYRSGILRPEYWGSAGLLVVPFVIQRFIR